MCARVSLTLAAVLLLASAALADDTKQIDPEKGEKAVKEQLEKYRATFGQVTHVKDASLAKALPKHIFFTAHFRQYPVARALPEPLTHANIFAYRADGKLTLLNEAKALKNFFVENAARIEGDSRDAAKDVTRAWLKLSPELQQDGFYKFVIMDDSIKATLERDKFTFIKAAGKVVVMQGGNGAIEAKLSWKNGSLYSIDHLVEIRPGPRPICQATKLLDPDPIVRKMAEQDLLIMGTFAKPYLDEQRAKATPELRGAIDRLWQRILKEDR
jgi:hypothetical protein